VLILAGVPFEDERINHSQWAELKPKTPYGQLPIVTMTNDDGSEPIVRAQSTALMRWLASEYAPDTLYPRSNLYEIEEAMGVLDDMMSSWAPGFYMAMRPQTYGYPEGHEKTDEGKKLIRELREKYVYERMPELLKHLERLLAKHNNQFLASSSGPTIADCLAVPMLRSFTRGYIDFVPATCLDAYPVIVEYIKRFCALEQVKGRYDSGIH